MSRDEFSALLEPHLGRAYGVALHLTRNAADAEDLVQEAALLAWRGFATFERGTNFRAWFLRVLTNAFLSGQRKKRPEAEALSLDEVPSAFIQRRAHEQVSDESPAGRGLAGGDLAKAVLGKLEADQVAAAIDALPEEFRVAAALYFQGDQSYQAIAAALGVPVGTVRSRLHRGRALLQRRLWELAVDHGLVAEARAERRDA